MNLLSPTDIATVTGIFGSHFDTFTHGRTRLITVNKQAIVNVVSQNTNPMYGYDTNSAGNAVTYSSVSRQFPAIVNYNLVQQQDELNETKNRVDVGKVKIKVERDCRDYIKNGQKTENIQFDGKTYNKITDDGVQNFLELVYYVFQLEATL